MKIKGENFLLGGGIAALVILATMDKRLMRGGNLNKKQDIIREFIDEKVSALLPTKHGAWHLHPSTVARSHDEIVNQVYEQFKNDPHEFLSELDDWMKAHYGFSLTEQGYFANINDAAAEEMRIVEKVFRMK